MSLAQGNIQCNQRSSKPALLRSRVKQSVVRPRSNGYIYICLFVNIEIKTFGWHIQKSSVDLQLFVVCMDSSVGRIAASRKSIPFPLCAGSNPMNALIFFWSFFPLIMFGQQFQHLYKIALNWTLANTKIHIRGATECINPMGYIWGRIGSVVECLTQDRRAACSSLTGVTVLWSLSKTYLS